MNDFNQVIKIIIIGNSGVGKTNILTRIINNKFNFATTSTIGIDFYTKLININEAKLKVQIWDIC